jgi:hypothetical protein
MSIVGALLCVVIIAAWVAMSVLGNREQRERQNKIDSTRLSPSRWISKPGSVLEALSGAFIPMPRPKDDAHDRQHDRNFDQYANNRRKGGTRIQAEKGDGGCNRELEKVARANERGWAGDAKGRAHLSIEPIGQPGVEVNLDQNWNGKHQYDPGLRKNLLALEAKEQNQRQQQRSER